MNNHERFAKACQRPEGFKADSENPEDDPKKKKSKAEPSVDPVDQVDEDKKDSTDGDSDPEIEVTVEDEDPEDPDDSDTADDDSKDDETADDETADDEPADGEPKDKKKKKKTSDAGDDEEGTSAGRIDNRSEFARLNASGDGPSKKETKGASLAELESYFGKELAKGFFKSGMSKDKATKLHIAQLTRELSAARQGLDASERKRNGDSAELKKAREKLTDLQTKLERAQSRLSGSSGLTRLARPIRH